MRNGCVRKSAKHIGGVKSLIFSGDGFTAVELSAVIMVISIVLLIAFPVFLTVTQNSKTKTCVSTLKVIDSGLIQYAGATGINPVNLGDIVPAYVERVPLEPSGGSYILVAATSSAPVHVECSKGHSY